MTKDQIIELALKLPREDQREVIQRLGDANFETAFSDEDRAVIDRELERRRKAYREGRSELISLEEFKAQRSERRARAKLRQAAQD